MIIGKDDDDAFEFWSVNGQFVDRTHLNAMVSDVDRFAMKNRMI